MWPASVTLNSGKSLMDLRARHSQLLPMPPAPLCENPSPSLNWQNTFLWMYWMRQGKGSQSCRATHYTLNWALAIALSPTDVPVWLGKCTGLAVAAMIQQFLQVWPEEKVCPYPRRLTGHGLLAGILLYKAVTYATTSVPQLKSFKTKPFKIKYLQRMSSCLIMEKAFSFPLYNKKMPIRLWIQSYTVCPTCLQQYHRPVSPSQPQAQAPVLKASKAPSRGRFITSKNFSPLFRFSLLADAR